MLNDDEIAEYEDRLRIDRNALDDAVAEQADIYYRVARAYSEASDLAEAAKAGLDIADSAKATALREDAERTNAKLTEGRLSEQVLTSQEHAKALANHQDRRATAKRLNDLREAYQQRAEALKRMVDLYIGQYFTVSAIRVSVSRQTTATADTGRAAMAAARALKPPPKQT